MIDAIARLYKYKVDEEVSRYVEEHCSGNYLVNTFDIIDCFETELKTLYLLKHPGVRVYCVVKCDNETGECKLLYVSIFKEQVLEYYEKEKMILAQLYR